MVRGGDIERLRDRERPRLSFLPSRRLVSGGFSISSFFGDVTAVTAVTPLVVEGDDWAAAIPRITEMRSSKTLILA